MTKKVFIEAAKLIKDRFPLDLIDAETRESTRLEVANTFAILFARHNASFNKLRFFEACGL